MTNNCRDATTEMNDKILKEYDDDVDDDDNDDDVYLAWRPRGRPCHVFWLTDSGK